MGRFRDVELDDVEIPGDRLILRRWQPADAESVHQIMTDRSMYEFLALPDPYTLDLAMQFVTSIGHEGRGDGTGLGCAVIERGSHRLVGSAVLRLGGDPEIGYWIAPAARGNGYAAEATRMLTTWAFGMGLRRVGLVCDVRNLASVRTAMAAGFAFEGVSREGISTAPGPGTFAGRADRARFARLVHDSGERTKPTIAALPAAGLSDGVLALRTIRPSDGPALTAMDDEIANGWGFSGVPADPAVHDRVAAASGLDWLVSGPARMAMLDVATGAVAGEFTVRLAGPPQVGGIGYLVHPAFRGRGFTTRALRLIVPWAFGAADFARLELGAKAGNVASQRAAENAGFEADGISRVRLRNPDGTFSDEVCYALTNWRYGAR